VCILTYVGNFIDWWNVYIWTDWYGWLLFEGTIAHIYQL